MGNGSVKILVIDDTDFNREAIVTHLRYSEISADAASNGKEGYSMYAQNKYSLILLDMYMPVMDGLEFLKKYRQLITTPIIAYTGTDDREILDQAARLGADLVIRAPLQPDLLIPNIKSIIGKYSQWFDKDSYITKYISVDFRKRTVALMGEPVHFTHTEFRIL